MEENKNNAIEKTENLTKTPKNNKNKNSNSKKSNSVKKQVGKKSLEKKAQLRQQKAEIRHNRLKERQKLKEEKKKATLAKKEELKKARLQRKANIKKAKIEREKARQSPPLPALQWPRPPRDNSPELPSPAAPPRRRGRQEQHRPRGGREPRVHLCGHGSAVPHCGTGCPQTGPQVRRQRRDHRTPARHRSFDGLRGRGTESVPERGRRL